MQIGEKILRWDRSGAGPFSDSEWMTLNGEKNGGLLVIRSQEEPFPDESLAEIRQERMLTAEEEKDFPPSKIEIVLGTEGRLFVVLPTGIKTALPFACNGPFIQDPARLKIKDPETSPTNRWLLEACRETSGVGYARVDTSRGSPDRRTRSGLWPSPRRR